MQQRNAKQAIRDVAQQLKDQDRASAHLRTKGRDADLKKWRDAYQQIAYRYAHDREALLAERSYTCPYCGTEHPPTVLHIPGTPGDGRWLQDTPPRIQIVERERCGCPAEIAALRVEQAKADLARRAFEGRQWSQALQVAGLVGWMATATFENYRAENHSQRIQKTQAEAYTENLLAGNLGDQPWLVFYGPFGTGKTHLAAAIIHDAMRVGWRKCRLAVWTEYIERIKATFDGDGNTDDVLAELRDGQLVCIDDIDKQKPTDWTAERLYSVLNHRYNHLLPTILTFNRPPDEMAPWLGMALIDRLLEVQYQTVQFNGRSYRSDTAWGS